MSRSAARFISTFLTVALMVGTLMPGSWKSAATPALAIPIDLAVLAHVVLFAGICFTIAPAQFWSVRSWQVLLAALALALLSEGLQFFAIDRHPNLAGVFQDMVGAVVGWTLGRLRAR